MTCTQQGSSDQFSVTHNWYQWSDYDWLTCDVVDSRDNQPLLYAIGGSDDRECQRKWDRVKSTNSYRCSDDRYVTLLHDGGRGRKLKLNLNGQDFSVSRKECIKVPVNGLEQASITVGKKEVCKPGGNSDCWSRFYSDHNRESYGYTIEKLSAGIFSSPPYFYHYNRINLLDGCKEIND